MFTLLTCISTLHMYRCMTLFYYMYLYYISRLVFVPHAQLQNLLVFSFLSIYAMFNSTFWSRLLRSTMQGQERSPNTYPSRLADLKCNGSKASGEFHALLQNLL